MPTYDYRCAKGHRFELFHSIRDESVKRCPKCGARAKRVPAGGAGLLFKGSGFYITDYRSRSYKEKAKQEKTGGSAAPAGEKSGGSGASGGTSGGAGASGGAGSSGGSGAGGKSGDSRAKKGRSRH